MKDNITIGDKYGPAMEISDQAEADAYLEQCIRHSMDYWGKSREEATAIEKANLGYYSGYYDTATMQRVQRLFNCSHPIFGKATPSASEALEAGRRMAKGERDE